MDKSRIHRDPSHVAAEEGVVIVEGPDGLAFSMTPDAAMDTADRLFKGGVEAAGQRAMREQEHPVDGVPAKAPTPNKAPPPKTAGRRPEPSFGPDEEGEVPPGKGRD